MLDRGVGERGFSKNIISFFSIELLKKETNTFHGFLYVYLVFDLVQNKGYFFYYSKKTKDKQYFIPTKEKVITKKKLVHQ